MQNILYFSDDILPQHEKAEFCSYYDFNHLKIHRLLYINLIFVFSFSPQISTGVNNAWYFRA